MDAVVDETHADAARRTRAHLAVYEGKRDLVTLGAYRAGSDPRLDAALAKIDSIHRFLQQGRTERASFEETRQRLGSI
jgi:flagellar biosynthesis/type III secretory pathway ATPase